MNNVIITIIQVVIKLAKIEVAL